MHWPRRDWQKSAGPAVIEFLDPIEPGLGKAEFMTLLESRMESATARLVREHGGEPYDMPVIWEEGVENVQAERIEAGLEPAS